MEVAYPRRSYSPPGDSIVHGVCVYKDLHDVSGPILQMLACCSTCT